MSPGRPNGSALLTRLSQLGWLSSVPFHIRSRDTWDTRQTQAAAKIETRIAMREIADRGRMIGHL
jgi:hypothetical protein